MTDCQDNKAIVLQYYEELEVASADAVAEALWKPLLGAFTQIQRRQDIFMAGANEKDGTEWLISMGHNT